MVNSVPGRPLELDTDELRRLSCAQQEILGRTSSARIGDELSSAPAALPELSTAGACVAAGAAIDALIDDVLSDMSRQALALSMAADRFDGADADAAESLSGQMNL